MGKQYCKMTLKELLEYLSSVPNDANESQEDRQETERDNEQSVEEKEKKFVTIDVETQNFVVFSKGVHAICPN